MDWAPAYELLVSLKAYTSTADRKILELGAAWVKEVRAAPVAAAGCRAGAREHAVEKMWWLDLLVRQAPPPRDAAAFLGWLATLSGGEMYERLAPQAAESGALPGNLGAARDRAVERFDGLGRRVLPARRCGDPGGLGAEAARTRALIELMEPLALVEQATNGVYFVPEPRPDVVLLIPQYHYRPWNVFSIYREVRIDPVSGRRCAAGGRGDPAGSVAPHAGVGRRQPPAHPAFPGRGAAKLQRRRAIQRPGQEYRPSPPGRVAGGGIGPGRCLPGRRHDRHLQPAPARPRRTGPAPTRVPDRRASTNTLGDQATIDMAYGMVPLRPFAVPGEGGGDAVPAARWPSA